MYAGFWLRAVAFLIDAILLTVVNFIVNPHYLDMIRANHAEAVQAGVVSGQAGMLILIVIRWLYFTVLESSAWQGTIGKKLLGIRVTDMAGNRIGFGRANGRFWSKIISAIILGIGFFMAGFTEKKQALHDIIAKTLVVRNA